MFSLSIIAKLLLVIGGFIWGVYGLMTINVVKRILPHPSAQKALYILFGIAAIILLFDKTFYLPFLSKTVLPNNMLKSDFNPDGSMNQIKVQVKVPANTRVIFWASNNKNDNDSVKVAYGKFENSGITTSDSNGIATLVLHRPSGYRVPTRKLKPHVHYRYVLSDSMLSNVFTKRLTKKDLGLTGVNISSESFSDSDSDVNSLVQQSDANANGSVMPMPNPNVQMANMINSIKSIHGSDSLTHILQDRNISKSQVTI
jgi:uncharacterized membrane protein YuzA (DUF378 family)